MNKKIYKNKNLNNLFYIRKSKGEKSICVFFVENAAFVDF